MGNRTILRCFVWTNLLHFIKFYFKFHGQKNLAGYTVHGAPVSWIQPSDWTHRLFHASQFRSGAQSCMTLQSHGLQHTRCPCPLPTPGAYSNSCPSSWWCRPTISSSVLPFSSCLQPFPASGSFQMSQLFTANGQSIRVSLPASVLPKNIQDWFPLELTGLISLLSKGISRVFSNTTVQKHRFFGTQLSL